MELTVVITNYNEIKTVLQAVNDAKLIGIKDKEIIIIDNCSSDGSRDLLKKISDPSINVILQNKNYGFGKSIELGLSIAKGKYTYIHHSDNEYDYRYVEKMLCFAEKHDLDILLGSRIKDFTGSKWALVKQRPEYLATIISTYLINLWYGKRFTDIIGSRLYKTDTIKKVPVTSYIASFDFESISRICKRKLKIEEIAIGYTPRICRKDKKMKWHHMLDAISVMFKVRFFEP